MNRFLQQLVLKLILLGTLFYSCGNKNKSIEAEKANGKIIENKNSKIESETSSFVESKEFSIPIYDECTNYDNRLSTVASKIRFVAIDSVMLLRDFFVYDVALCEEYIFLSSYDYIYQYDKNGKFVRKVGGKGMGPKEYVLLSPPLQIDEENKLLYAIDEQRNRIMVYDFNGNLFKAIPVGDECHVIALLDSTTLAIRTTFEKRFEPNTLSLLLIDTEGKKIKAFKSYLYPANGRAESYGPQANYLWNCRENYYTMEYGNDTVFRITKSMLIPRLVLTGKLALTKDELFKREQGNKKTIIGPLFRPNSAIFESDHFIIFRIYQKEEAVLLAYNKETGEIHQTSRQENIAKPEYTNDLNYSYYQDDLVSGMPFYPLYQSNGKAIAILSASNVVENKQKILDHIQAHPSEEADHLKEIVNRLDETDNSLLMIVEFK